MKTCSWGVIKVQNIQILRDRKQDLPFNTEENCLPCKFALFIAPDFLKSHKIKSLVFSRHFRIKNKTISTANKLITMNIAQTKKLNAPKSLLETYRTVRTARMVLLLVNWIM